MTAYVELNGKRVELVKDGFAYHSGSFGAFWFEEAPNVHSVILSNGATGTDEPCAFFFDCITINAGAPVSMHPRICRGFGTDGRIQIGTPNGQRQHYFPVGGLMVVRFTTNGTSIENIYTRRAVMGRQPMLSKPIAGQHDLWKSQADTMLAVLKTGQPNAPLQLFKLMGPWMPLGFNQPGVVSGDGINPVPGWEDSSEWSLLRVDLTAERMPVAYHSLNGVPWTKANQPVYRPTRGWGAWTKHAEYVVRDNNSPDPDARLPKQRDNDGRCDYASTLDTYQAHDAQHLIRATADAMVGWMRYGDKASRWLLKMYAADAEMGIDYDGLSKGVPGSGSGLLGRAHAWTLHACYAIGNEAYSALARAGERLRMPNHAWMRAESIEESNLGWSPPAWSGAGVPTNVGCYPTREGGFMAVAMFHAGYNKQAGNYANGVLNASFDGIPKNFVGVSRDGLVESLQFGGWGGVESYNLWPIVGLLAREDKRRWVTFMQRMIPPGGNAPCGKDVKEALRKAGHYEVTAAAMEVL